MLSELVVLFSTDIDGRVVVAKKCMKTGLQQEIEEVDVADSIASTV